MSDKRYLGNIITPTPTEPAGPFQNDAAPGVWSLQEAFTYTKAGLWPTAGNVLELALFMGDGANANVVSKITITTTGNAVDYVDAQGTRRRMAAMGSSTRALFTGSLNGSYSNVIEFTTYSSSGSTSDFGDTIGSGVLSGGGASNETRGLFFGGDNGSRTNVIQYVTIASAGNAVDFGDMTVEKEDISGCASSTRAVMGGGVSDTPSFGVNNTIDYVTISTTGNAVDFGDQSVTRSSYGSCSSSTRGLFAGGSDIFGSAFNVIDYITIATTGNATDFGDLTRSDQEVAGAAGKTRAVFAGGRNSGVQTNEIDFVIISTTGNATDFGDLLAVNYSVGATSNVHGGLS